MPAMDPFFLADGSVNMEYIDAVIKGRRNDLGDPFDSLIRRLPHPETDYYGTPNLIQFPDTTIAAGLVYLMTCLTSTDPNNAFVLDRMLKFMKGRGLNNYGFVITSLAALAIKKPPAKSDKSLKAQQLRYIRWIARGRKDEESPIGRCGDPFVVIPAEVSPVDHSLLPSPKEVPCATCSKLCSSDKVCSGCVIRTDGRITFATCYCSKDCQTAHWKHHKAFCKALRRLYRSISIFQEIYLMFLDMTSDPQAIPTGFHECNGMVTLTLPDFDMRRGWGFRGEPIIGKFPADLAPNDELKKLAMMRAMGGDVFKAVGSLFDYFLYGGSVSGQPLFFQPKNIHKPAIVHDATGALTVEYHSLFKHTVAIVTLPGLVKFVIDPTGAQYGWKEIIAPYDKYAKHHIQFIDDTIEDSCHIHRHAPRRDGTLKHVLNGLSIDKNGRNCCDQKGVRVAFAQCLFRSLTDYISDDTKYLSLPNIVEYKEAQFKEAKNNLLSFTEKWLVEELACFRMRKDFRYYLNTEDKTLKYAIERKLVKKLRRMWLTDEEFERHKNSPSSLNLIWEKRWRRWMMDGKSKGTASPAGGKGRSGKCTCGSAPI